MKTIIFCTSFINDDNSVRYINWIDYYRNKLDLFNVSNLFLIDDGSSNISFDDRVEIVKSKHHAVHPVSLATKLMHRSDI